MLTVGLLSASFYLAMIKKKGDSIMVLLRLLGILALFFAACAGNAIVLVVVALGVMLLNQLNPVGVAAAVIFCVMFIY